MPTLKRPGPAELVNNLPFIPATRPLYQSWRFEPPKEALQPYEGLIWLGAKVLFLVGIALAINRDFTKDVVGSAKRRDKFVL